MSRWGVRARLVAATGVLLALALVAGAVAVAVVFSAGLVRELDRQTAAESAVVVALVQQDRLPRVLPVPAGSTLLAQVLAADGSVLAASPSASPLQALVDGRRRGGVTTVEGEDFSGVPLRLRVVAAQGPGGAVRVVVAAPLSDVRRALQALRLVLLVVVPVLLLAAVGAVRRVTGRALRPVEQLRLAAERLAADPLRTDAMPTPPGDDEVARLARTLDTLLTSLRALVERQRSFVADAAHELRSPVTSLRVQLDVAAAHPASSDPAALMQGLGAEVDRLSALTDALLALARADSAPTVRVRVDLRELAGARGESVCVLGDPAALASLVGNMVQNAGRHAGTVRTTVRREAGDAVLDVDDDGPGIAVADRERVFERWVRLDDARTRGDGGAGLGLALVRGIARAHGGEVAVLDSPLGGARLRVRLPAAP